MAMVECPGEKVSCVISPPFDDRNKCASAPIKVDEIGLKEFYVEQLKKIVFTLLSSTSTIDEWRQLSGRDDGKEI